MDELDDFGAMGASVAEAFKLIKDSVFLTIVKELQIIC